VARHSKFERERRTAETERVNVLYRRTDGDFGLIEPIIGGEYTAGQGRPGSGSNGRN